LRRESPLEQRIAANKRRAFKLAAVFGTLVFLVVTLLFAAIQAGPWSALIGLIVAGAWVGIAWFQADAVVLDLLDVEEADPKEHARLFNVAAGMCAAMGLKMPDLYVVDEAGLNALAVGRDARHASVVVTTGLLAEANLVELEAVVALELYRIKSREIAAETFIVLTIGVFGVLSEAADKWDGLSRFLALPMPLIEKAIAAIHPSRGELDTDLGAVEFTRYPPALAAGLEKMSGRSALAIASPVTIHLWAAPPISLTTSPFVSLVHAPLSERIAVLQEL
jgi:heat shock protein HtpX